MRRRLEVRRVETPAYVKLLPILVLLAGLALPTSIALGFDQLDPSYGERLVVRDPQGNIIEVLYPRGGQFDVSGPNGENLGFAKHVGTMLVFYDEDGRLTATARQQLLPPNYSISAIALVRDLSGNPIGMITRH